MYRQQFEESGTNVEWAEPEAPESRGSAGGDVPGGECHQPSATHSWRDRWLAAAARRLVHSLDDLPVELAVAGRSVYRPPGRALARIRFSSFLSLLRVALNPLSRFGDAFADGQVEVEGDLVQLLELVYRATPEPGRLPLLWRLLQFVDRGPRNSSRRARQQVSAHYDLGNNFYRLWLDRQLVYTCAYFQHPDLTLEAAQVAKLDYVCRKLQLRPGQHVVEAGCGWGALALHMAERYGARVTAFNVSQAQIAYARQEARRRGLNDQVDFREQDWREIDLPCDAFVSVGMLEHVGRRHYRQLGRIMACCLRRYGYGLVHSISQNYAQPLNPWIRRRIFPGAYPPTLREMMALFEPQGLSVLDVENLRAHYALTLKHWTERFEAAAGQVETQFGPKFGPQFVRAWRLYLAGSQAAFDAGSLQLYQVLFRNGDLREPSPSTRARWYTGQQPIGPRHLEAVASRGRLRSPTRVEGTLTSLNLTTRRANHGSV